MLIERGTVHKGGLVFAKPLPLSEGTEVTVRIEPLGTTQPTSEKPEEFAALPFFGMWADREDMHDSVAWVQKERERWAHRLQRPA